MLFQEFEKLFFIKQPSYYADHHVVNFLETKCEIQNF